MFRFIVLASVLALSVQGQYNPDSKNAAIISEQRYLQGDGQFGNAYVQEDGIEFKEETDADGTRHGQYSYVEANGQKRTLYYTAGKNGFQASGDHLPVAPPAPAHATLAAQQAAQYNAQAKSYDLGGADGFDDGQYDPRYNDPHFQGNQNHHYTAPAAQPQPQYVAQQPQQAAPQPQPNYNQNNINYVAQYQSTTPNPHRFQPPANYEIKY
ncbi:pupal cuticle protein Edg-78E isoform X2 [Sitodiplosis mosellana]|uniref:pupal cuticle protein Edg-78E isoform X2 n=1 Tax=Sitodiplosis mosellana TaxID=263140 RepID=UPI002444FAEA|nr:pupal cuticle protein Edg-78E isoform X2 [Sitodiplosis mosellana]